MDLGIAGRVALVGGGSRGIGLGIATALAAEGVRVAIAARDASVAQAAADGIGAQAFAFDSSDLAAIPGLLDDVGAALGPIDIYIANTGGPPPGPDPLAFSQEQWEAAHRTLVLSPMEIIKRVLPGMRERRFGRVVAVSSAAVKEPIPTLQLSNAHRPGLIAAFKILAKGSAADGVTFNTLLPGSIDTDRIRGTSSDADMERLAASMPAKRLGRPDEMGAAAAFLCSVQAEYVNGTTLLVDGARTASV